MANAGVADKERIRALIAEVRPRLEALGVDTLGLFGSFVRGEQCVDSDKEWSYE